MGAQARAKFHFLFLRAVCIEMKAEIDSKKKEWNVCLSKSFGYPGKCEKIEKELRAVSAACGYEACVDQTLNLMRCTNASRHKGGCAQEFLAMRECSRATGRELSSTGSGGHTIEPGKQHLFSSEALLLATSTPPTRTLEGMTEVGQEFAKSLGMTRESVAF